MTEKKTVPGLTMDGADAVALDGRENVDYFEGVPCEAQVLVNSVVFGSKYMPKCKFPTPVFYLEGRIRELRGNLPNGINKLDYSDEAGTGAIGPFVRYNYVLSPAQISEMVLHRGLTNPEFEVIDIVKDYTGDTAYPAFDMPAVCRFASIQSDLQPGVPIMFVEVENAFELETNQAECGYDLVDLCKVCDIDPHFVRPLEQIEEHERKEVEMVTDNMLDEYNLDDEPEAEESVDASEMVDAIEAQAGTQAAGEVAEQPEREKTVQGDVREQQSADEDEELSAEDDSEDVADFMGDFGKDDKDEDMAQRRRKAAAAQHEREREEVEEARESLDDMEDMLDDALDF